MIACLRYNAKWLRIERFLHFSNLSTWFLQRSDSCARGFVCRRGILAQNYCAHEEEMKTTFAACTECNEDPQGVECRNVPWTLFEDYHLNAKSATLLWALCVSSTKWLENRGLSNKVIRHGGYTTVLCISGLPCGTPGHLLNRCTGSESCYLESYAEICLKRTDCSMSQMRFSQISHAFNWAQFSNEDGTLFLSSLSAHPNASDHRHGYSPLGSITYTRKGLVSFVTVFCLHFMVWLTCYMPYLKHQRWMCLHSRWTDSYRSLFWEIFFECNIPLWANK